jgi:secreted trypsin-like serine protease
LISKDLILTAAHCLQGKAEEKPKDINTFEVILGAHNLHDKSESNRQVIKPKEFIIHPRWNYSAIKYENDIGMIRLSDLARYDSFVYPICLKKSGPIISDGKTVGWGAINDEENSFSPVPMVLELKASELINCIFEIDERLFAIASINSFCAKGSTAGVCKGDSGSSFYVKKNGKNFLQGIVSSNTRVKCSERGATLFMDVQKYIDFIRVC